MHVTDMDTLEAFKKKLIDSVDCMNCRELLYASAVFECRSVYQY